jgi:membrane protein required for colicin V production
MNILDIIIIGLIAFFLIKGIFRGFFREISSLAGVVFGIVLGNRYHPQMADYLKAYIPFEKYLSLISFIIILLVTIIIFNLFGILLHKLFKRLLIGWFDRTLGICFALMKGIIVCYLIMVLLFWLLPTTPLIANSKTAPMVKGSFEVLRNLISPDLYRAWNKKIAKGSKQAEKMVSEGKEAIEKLPHVLPREKE